VLRLWVSSQDFRNDIIVSDERIAKVGESYRVIRNALRYQLSNLYDFDPDRDRVLDSELTGLDRWILGEFGAVEAEVRRAYDQHEFHVVYQKLSQFAAVQLSAIYHDVVKDRLYTDPAPSRRRRSTQTALYRLVRGLCQMLAPILAFTAEEAWEFVPGRSSPSVHAALWEPEAFAVTEAERRLWAQLFAERERVLPELERARQAKLIGKALEARVVRVCPPEAHGRLAGASEELKELLNVSQLELRAGPEDSEVVERAAGQKCERCWHWETDVGAQAAHPGLCGRCVVAVEGCRDDRSGSRP
jgi:isoleucyl-tRNA synthetase